MILHLTLLLVFQLAGEILRNTFGLVLPGPVIGMALLVMFLIAFPRVAETIRGTVQGFLAHLSLLFVPAGVGVVGHLDQLGSEGLGILLAVIISTVLAIMTSVLVFVAVARMMGARMPEFADIWSYLRQEPLLWLTVTLVAYGIGDAAFRAAGRSPFVNPVLVAVILLAGILWGTSTPYATYFDGAQFIHFMLGPATVGLAVPLYTNLSRIRSALVPMLAALIAGSLVAIASALAIGWAFGLREPTLLALAPKSATAPVAIGIAEAIGGSTTLTAVLVILTGITGAVVATPLLNLLGIRDWRARGFAVGVASHGIGTARAFQVNETAGAFAGIGMGLNALLTAILAPLVVSYFL